MAVEVVFLSMVLRRAALARITEEGRAAAGQLFRWQVDWFREDDHLVATSFMAPADVRAFGAILVARTGLERGLDWAVVDALHGLVEPTPWLRFRGGPGEPTGAWLEGTQPGELRTIRSLLPSWAGAPRATGKVLQAFGRDTTANEERPHVEKDGSLPRWGGTDLWLLEVAATGPDGQSGQMVAVEARGRDFLSFPR